MENRQSELGAVSRQMNAIRDQIDAGYQKLDRLHKRKSEILDKLKELRERAATYKASRDERNKIIVEKKAVRDQLHKDKAKISEKINELILRKRAVLSTVNDNEDELLWQLKEISWRYQTTSLTLNEDRKAVQRISELEKRLVIFKKVKEVDQDIGRHRAMFDELKAKANTVHSEILALAVESKNYHEALMKCYKDRAALVVELNQIKAETDKFRDEIGRSKDELFATQVQYKVVRNLAIKQKAETLAEQAKLIINRRSELAEKANEKLKNGGRLTFEEFAAMLEVKGTST
ncbi:MAG: hypothetical protein FJZ49_03795 [Candidatus Verstraetearchaeota archaeon]|nr:hypothetical protein [Candidatus Verstraetearchaeota archaeon]